MSYLIIVFGFATVICGFVLLGQTKQSELEISGLLDTATGLQARLDSCLQDLETSKKLEDWALQDLDSCMGELSRIRADASRELSKRIPPWENTK